MNLNPTEVNDYLQPILGRNEDGFQEAWLKILESQPQTLEEITPLAMRIRRKEINQYLNRKYKEVSLNTPIGKDGDENLTLESMLRSPESEDPEDRHDGENDLHRKMVDFILGEYIKQKSENVDLKRKNLELKAERLRLGRDRLNFKKSRFESWKKVMEDKTEQKENQFKLELQLQREKFEFQKEQFYYKEKRPKRRRAKQK